MVNSTRRNFFLGLIGLGGIGAAVATNPLAVLRGADERDRDVYQDIETILDERFISKTTWCRFWEGTGRPTFAEYASLVSDLSDLSSSQRKRRMRDLIDEDFRSGAVTHIDGWMMTSTEALISTALSDLEANRCSGRT